MYLEPDRSGLSQAEKRAALMVIQGGRCALCGKPRPPIADHDHDTGFLRGLLCRSCNRREGGGGWGTRTIRAYRVYPPAVGLHWLWDLPDWWRPADIDRCLQAGMTVADYVLALPGEGRRRREAQSAEAAAALATANLPRMEVDQ